MTSRTTRHSAQATAQPQRPLRKQRSSLTNTLSMGPAPLVNKIQSSIAAATSSLQPETSPIQLIHGTRRSTRVQQLQSVANTPAKSGKLAQGAATTVNLLSLTPNSSTLPVSPAGSSPGGSRKRPRTRKQSNLAATAVDVGTPSKRAGRPAVSQPPMDISHSVAPLGFGIVGEDIEGLEAELDEDEDDEADEESSLIDRMRLWRHDAMMQHLYDTAIFWGDKVLTWTNDPNDAFWLAQVYFHAGQFARAERLLTRPFPAKAAFTPQMPPLSPNPQIPQTSKPSFSQWPQASTLPSHPIVGSSVKGKGKGRAIDRDTSGVSDADWFKQPNLSTAPRQTRTHFLPPRSSSKPAPILRFNASFDADASLQEGLDLDADGSMSLEPLDEREGILKLISAFGAIGEGGSEEEDITRLVDISVTCRYLAAQCQTRQGKWSEALEILGEENPFREIAGSGPTARNIDGGIKLEATMCFLRGTIYMHLNRAERAKQCFLEALALDVKCYDAFNILVQNEMLTIDEEWALVQGLRYDDQTPDDAEFLRMMYTVRLKKLKHRDQIALARRKLANEFGLADNCDLLQTLAESLYTQFRWADCFAVTTRILELTSLHLPTIPLHVACMFHLKHLHTRLFLLAHELVEKEPELAISWYTVGIWYLVSGKWKEARQYLSKSTIMDSRLGPGWVAFAHTFAYEGEHEHAITAYSTCARLFQGSHLPHLYIGMEHLMLSNVVLAEDSLDAAMAICDSDPLVLNEQGVVAFRKEDYTSAIDYFQKALELARLVPGSESNWVSTICNLATAYRKQGDYNAAQDTYKQVLAIEPRHATALGSLGLVHHMQGEYTEAIERYHQALSVEPLDGNIVELLNLALATVAEAPVKMPKFDKAWVDQVRATNDRDWAWASKTGVEDEIEKGSMSAVGWDFPYGASSAWA